LRGWLPDSNSWIEHEKAFPYCAFVNQVHSLRINPKDIIPADDEEEEEPKDQEGAARLL
jgi:hypothetical protein